MLSAVEEDDEMGEQENDDSDGKEVEKSGENIV